MLDAKTDKYVYLSDIWNRLQCKHDDLSILHNAIIALMRHEKEIVIVCGLVNSFMVIIYRV